MTVDPAAVTKAHLLDRLLARRAALVTLAAGITGCRPRAEDVVQDVAVKLMEGGAPAAVRDPDRYLARMVRNAAIDGLRRRAREPVCPHLDEDAGGDGQALCRHSLCPERTMAGCQALRLVLTALDELPARTRDTFAAHRLDGVPQKDIAGRLGVSPTLVNFMVRAAHDHCRARLHHAEGLPQPEDRQSRLGT